MPPLRRLATGLYVCALFVFCGLMAHAERAGQPLARLSNGNFHSLGLRTTSIASVCVHIGGTPLPALCSFLPTDGFSAAIIRDFDFFPSLMLGNKDGIVGFILAQHCCQMEVAADLYA